MGSRPAFPSSVDTEGDNQRSRLRGIATRNARFLPPFQDLGETRGVKPGYLANPEIAGAGPRTPAALGRAKYKQRRYVEFITHSSGALPGVRPYFTDEESIEALHATFARVFAQPRRNGQKLATFREGFDADARTR